MEYSRSLLTPGERALRMLLAVGCREMHCTPHSSPVCINFLFSHLQLTAGPARRLQARKSPEEKSLHILTLRTKTKHYCRKHTGSDLMGRRHFWGN